MTNQDTTQPAETPIALDDNARKFITEPLEASLLEATQAKSFTLAVDWLKTDESSEEKLARKTFEDGSVQILLISKVTHENGSRETVKKPITEEEYRELLAKSTTSLEKKRYEFNYAQDGATFEMKYDVFSDSDLIMLEVDAASDMDREAFVPEHFPAALREVTGDLNYYGYRVCAVL